MYAEDGSNLDKLNDFIASSSKAFLAFFRDVSSNVLTAEEFFCTDGTIDIASGRKLTIYISPNEILQAHRHMLENLDEIGSDTNSQLRQILNDIGTPPPAPADGARQGGEINLVLINRFAKIQSIFNLT